MEQHTPASECPETLHYNIVRVNTNAHIFTCTVHISCCTTKCEATYIDTKKHTHNRKAKLFLSHVVERLYITAERLGTNSLTSYVYVNMYLVWDH